MAASAVRELVTKIKFITDGSGLETAKTKISDLKDRMSRVSKEKIKLDVDTSKLEAAKEKLGSLGSKLTGGGMALSAAGAGLLGAVGLPVKTAADFEATMSKVRAITGSTDEQMQKLTATARQLGRDTIFSASEAGEAMTYLGMAGWKTEQIIAGMPGLLDLAAASGGDLARTADIISDDITAFGIEATTKNIQRFSDVFAAASMNANTNTELMGYTFKYVGAVCGALGYTIEDAALATGLLANAGIKGEMAGTQLRATITRLISPTAEAAKVMQQLGISATNEDGSMKTLRQTMMNLRQTLGGLTKEQQAQAAEALAGKEAMTGLLSIVNASQADFDKLAMSIDNSNGAAHNFAEVSKDNLMGSLKELKSAAEEFAIAAGSALLPALRGIVKGVRTAVNWFNSFAAEHPTVVAGLMGIAAALGALLAGLGTIGVFVGGLMSLGSVFVGIGAAIAPIIAGLGGLIPIIAAIAAVFGLVASAISFVQDNWTIVYQWLSPGLADLQEGVNEFGKAWEALTPIIELLKPIFYEIIQIVGALLIRHFVIFFNVASSVFKTLAELASWLAEKISGLLGPIQSVANGIAGLISGAREFLGLKGVSSASFEAEASAMRNGGSTTVNQENNIVVNSTDEAVDAANGFGDGGLEFAAGT